MTLSQVEPDSAGSKECGELAVNWPGRLECFAGCFQAVRYGFL
jgi:hypothetical protein